MLRMFYCVGQTFHFYHGDFNSVITDGLLAELDLADILNVGALLVFISVRC